MQAHSPILSQITRRYKDVNFGIPKRRSAVAITYPPYVVPTVTSDLAPVSVPAGVKAVFQMTATGSNTIDCPIRWSYNIPAPVRSWLTGHPSGQVIANIPIDYTPGTISFPVTARNCAGVDTETLVITVGPPGGATATVYLGYMKETPAKYTAVQIQTLPKFVRAQVDGSYDVQATGGNHLVLAWPAPGISPRVSVNGAPIPMTRVNNDLLVGTTVLDVWRSGTVPSLTLSDRTDNPVIIDGYNP